MDNLTCPRTLPRLLAGLVLLSSCFLLAPPVAAHAIVMASEPPAGSVLGPGSQRTELRFNNRIDRKRSRVVLAGPLGDPGASVPEQVLVLQDVPADDVLVTEFSVGIAGQYRLRWQVLALDGHVTRGEVPFTVALPVR